MKVPSVEDVDQWTKWIRCYTSYLLEQPSSDLKGRGPHLNHWWIKISNGPFVKWSWVRQPSLYGYFIMEKIWDLTATE